MQSSCRRGSALLLCRARPAAAAALRPALSSAAAAVAVPFASSPAAFPRPFSSSPAQPRPAASASPRFARRPKAATASSSHAAYVGPPLLSALLRRFNLLVHPDLFGDAPEHQAANQKSLQALNSLLSSLRTREQHNEYPPQQKLQLVFYVRKRHGDDAWFAYLRGEDAPAAAKAHGSRRNNLPARHRPRAAASAADPPKRGDILQNEFHIVPVLLTTTGGQCKQLLAGQLTSMFQRAGLQAKDFRWDPDYWQMGGPTEWAKRQPVEEEEDEYQY